MTKFNVENFTFDNESIEVSEKEISAPVIFINDEKEFFFLPDNYDGYLVMFAIYKIVNGKGKLFFEFSHSDFDPFITKILNQRFFSESEKQAFIEKFYNSLINNKELIRFIKDYSIDISKLISQMKSYFEKQHRKSIKREYKAKKTPCVINIFGGPGSGKSTLALELTATLKKMGYNADYVPEVAKDYVYAGKADFLKSETALAQMQLLNMQKKRIDLCIKGKVDYIVTDSPLLLNLAYYSENNSSRGAKNTYEKYVKNTFLKYNNINMYLFRDALSYETNGRVQSYQEALEKDEIIKDVLNFAGVKTYDIWRNSVDDIIKNILHL